MSTLVIQSHRFPLPHPWLDKCLESVRRWAEAHSFKYQFMGDELFHGIDPAIKCFYMTRPVILSDFARLLAMERALTAGFKQVLWLDADTYILDPHRFYPDMKEFVVGREHWIQPNQTGCNKVYTKVHNAYLFAHQGTVSLPFYIDVAKRLLLHQTGQIPDQFIGPKLLTALHNIVRFNVQETAVALAPEGMKDIINGGGEAYELLKTHSTIQPAAANLCASSVRNGELSDTDIETFIRNRENLTW